MPAYTLELVDWIETLAAQSNLRREGRKGKGKGKISAPTALLSFSPRFVSDVFATRLETASVKKLVESQASEHAKKMRRCYEMMSSMLGFNFSSHNKRAEIR